MDVVGFAVLAMLAVLFVVWLVALVDAARTPFERFEEAGQSKGLVLLLVFFTGGFGGTYWLAVVRRRVRHP